MRQRVLAGVVVLALGSGAGFAYAIENKPAVGPLNALKGGKTPNVKPLASMLDDVDLGGDTSAVVIDAQSGVALLERQQADLAIPASPMKILTATAALHVLGPSKRLVTRVVSTAPVIKGVINGDLVLIGAGDPTLTIGIDKGKYPTPASLDILARQVRKAGVTQVNGRLLLDATLFAGPTRAPGWRDSYVREGSVAPVSALEVDEGRPASNPERGPRSQQPISDTGNAFATALINAGVHTSRPTIEGSAPAGAKTVAIASVQSAPVRELVERMLQDSDNDLAECLGRLVAVQRKKTGTFSAAAEAIRDTMNELGLPLPEGSVLVDASGLSRDDQLSAAYLVSVLRFVLAPEHAQMRVAATGLPVAGVSGTLERRFRNAAAEGGGIVRAKTGSLAGVSSLVGTVTTRGGRLLIFAVFAQAAQSRTKAEAALDRFAASLAALA